MCAPLQKSLLIANWSEEKRFFSGTLALKKSLSVRNPPTPHWVKLAWAWAWAWGGIELVFMCVCVHVCMYVCMYAWWRRLGPSFESKIICFKYVCMYVYIHVCILIRFIKLMYVCICMRMAPLYRLKDTGCMCVYVYEHIYAWTSICMSNIVYAYLCREI